MVRRHIHWGTSTLIWWSSEVVGVAGIVLVFVTNIIVIVFVVDAVQVVVLHNVYCTSVVRPQLAHTFNIVCISFRIVFFFFSAIFIVCRTTMNFLAEFVLDRYDDTLLQCLLNLAKLLLLLLPLSLLQAIAISAMPMFRYYRADACLYYSGDFWLCSIYERFPFIRSVFLNRSLLFEWSWSDMSLCNVRNSFLRRFMGMSPNTYANGPYVLGLQHES